MGRPWPPPVCEDCKHEISNAGHIDRKVCDKCQDNRTKENQKRYMQKLRSQRGEINANEKSA